MKSHSLWVILLFFVTLTVNAQSKLIYTSSGDAIEKGIKASDDEKYATAIRSFLKVHEGDTNYHRAQYELVNTLILDEQYERAIKTALEELKSTPETGNMLYTALGNAYDKNDQPEKSIEAYTEGLKTYPMYYGLYYNRAVTYIGLEKWDLAVLDLQQSVKLNPFHDKSHFQLGKLAEEEGQQTKAMLCYDTYLMLKPGKNLEFLTHYNDFLNSEYDGDPKNITLSTDDYSEIDALIQNRIALNSKYKTGLKLTLPYAKQNHLLMNQLQERTLGNGFWDTYYVPLYMKMMQEDMFDGFIYYTLQSVTNSSIIKVLEKNIKELKAFPSWAGPNIQNLHSDYEEEFMGKKTKVHYYWNNIESVSGRGQVKDLEPYGNFEYFYVTGNRSASGVFDTIGDGERNGKWTYFHKNGTKSGIENFDDGDLVGVDSNYWDNGNIKSYSTYENGKLVGVSKTYYKNGVLKHEVNFIDDKLEGQGKYYYKIGALHHDVNFADGEITQKFIEYHPNQVIAEEVSFEVNLRQGVSKKFYDNGSKYLEEEYADGVKNGPYKKYYRDGTLMSEGEYKNGVIINTTKEYNPNGTLSSEGIYDEDGKQNGIYKEYDLSGKLNLVLNYKKGELISYQVYHRNGELIKEAKKKSGEFFFENFYSDGTIKATGTYKPGNNGKSGEWKFYDKNGALSAVEFYENGKLEGTLQNFYANGNVYYETTYKNGGKEGIYTQYYRSGKKSKQGYYIDGLAEGKWLYYERNGEISSENFFTKGELTGPQKYFTVDGKLDIVEYYDEGVNIGFELFDTTGVSYQKESISGDSQNVVVKSIVGVTIRSFHKKANISHGPSTRYYGDGKISGTGEYFNGDRHGPWVFYHNNGKVSSKGEYHYGDKHGKWEYFFENGKPSVVENRAYGDLTGKKIWYNESGKTDLEETYVNGLEHGSAYYYDGNGVLQYIREYFHGKVVGYSYPGSDGKPVELIPIVDETVDSKSYFANGKLSREFSMVKGKFEGVYNEYYENGKLMNTMVFKNNEKQGMDIAYYDNGQIKSEEPYVDNELNGVAKYYRKDGTLEKTITYFLDVLHGDMIYYNTSGSETKKITYYDGIIVSK